MNRGKKLAEGKTKIVYENANDDYSVFMYFKDDMTAGDGEKHDVFAGIGLISWEVNRNLFRALRSVVPTHYIVSPEERYAVVRRLDNHPGAVPLEIVVRRVATGSYLKRFPDAQEGDFFDPLKIEFFYKDDFLRDPMIDERHINVLKRKNLFYAVAEEHGRALFQELERKFAEQKYQLVDLKFEEGYVDGKQVVIDDLSPGSMRVWPYNSGSLELPVHHPRQGPVNVNIMSQLDRDGMLDKQLYREGHPEEVIMERFKTLADVTSRF